MVGEHSNEGIRISNRELYDGLMLVRDELRDTKHQLTSILGENVELRKRVRGLELRFYGVLAGLIGAFAVLLGGPIGVGEWHSFYSPC
jgi:hypothetical protein